MSFPKYRIELENFKSKHKMVFLEDKIWKPCLRRGHSVRFSTCSYKEAIGSHLKSDIFVLPKLEEGTQD